MTLMLTSVDGQPTSVPSSAPSTLTPTSSDPPRTAPPQTAAPTTTSPTQPTSAPTPASQRTLTEPLPLSCGNPISNANSIELAATSVYTGSFYQQEAHVQCRLGCDYPAMKFIHENLNLRWLYAPIVHLATDVLQHHARITASSRSLQQSSHTCADHATTRFLFVLKTSTVQVSELIHIRRDENVRCCC